MIDAAIAGLWLEGESTDHATLLRRGFERATAVRHPAQASRLALAADEHAFASYAQAERHQHWDSSPLHEGVARAAATARFCQRAVARAEFGPLRVSLQWRHYLAERERFVRHGAKAILRARRLWQRNKREPLDALIIALKAESQAFARHLTEARLVASQLWRLTRSLKTKGPNQLIVTADQNRLKQWQRWLDQVATKPAKIMTASPLLGVWQLSLAVHSTRPNANLVVVQQQNDDGTWTDLRQRHTIEFEAEARLVFADHQSYAALADYLTRSR